MKSKIWVTGWLVLILIALGIIGGWVYKIDPYFQYHKPDTDSYYYHLDNQRSQNNGIIKHFDYDAIIIGTSMTENFKTSEMDEIFGVNSIKVPFSGATYKEIDDNIEIALKNNPNLKTIVRALDMGNFFHDKDKMREDLGEYPTYLYDSNPFNDVKYIFNKDVIFERVYSMCVEKREDDFIPGITTFDEYSNWHYSGIYGINEVCPDGIVIEEEGEPIHLTDEQKEIIKANIEENVTSLTDNYPDVDFYYYFPPYSIAWWHKLVSNGTVYRQVEAEKYIIELILQHDNIHLYSFNNRIDVITDLNNYKDTGHHGQWINTMILKWLYEGENLLTKDNYEEYIQEELDFYISYDYASLNEQEDYEYDIYSAALFNEEYTGALPMNLLETDGVKIELCNAEIIEQQYENEKGIRCVGMLQREWDDEITISDYLINIDYVGAKIQIEDIGKHNYLVFWGKKLVGNGQPAIRIYNEKNERVADLTADSADIDNEWHRYVVDLSELEGTITIIMNGGAIDNTGSPESVYVFSKISLY